MTRGWHDEVCVWVCVCGGFGLESEGVGSKGLRSVRRVWGSSVNRGFQIPRYQESQTQDLLLQKKEKKRKETRFLMSVGGNGVKSDTRMRRERNPVLGK